MSRFAVANENLALLQDIIRQDPESYADEFNSRYAHFMSLLNVCQLDPENTDSEQTGELIDLVNFMSSVAHLYPATAIEFGGTITELLKHRGVGLPAELRLSLCKSLVVLRNRQVLPALDTLSLFMELVKCQDKVLRKFIYSSVINFLKNMNAKRRDQQLNSSLQLFMYAKLKDSRSIVVRTALLLLVDAYRKNVWPDARTANALAECCFHKVAKVQVSALKFFLGNKVDEAESSDDDDEGGKETRSLKQVTVGYRVGKKTNKRKKAMEQAKKSIEREGKKSKKAQRHDCNVRACMQLYDPQSMAERLMRRLEAKQADRFEIRLHMIALLAKLIGVHKLQVLSFYSYIQRFLQPHQREVTHLLLYAAQATHELVPPDIVQGLLRALSNNFITDRNSNEAIAVGLNTARQILANCPFAIDEDLLRDFAAYKKFKNKNVTVAARSLIQLYRDENPQLLHRKDRGMPSAASKEHRPAEFAVGTAQSAIAGAECLLAKKPTGQVRDGLDEEEEEEGEESVVDSEERSDQDLFSDTDGDDAEAQSSDSAEESDDDDDSDEPDDESDDSADDPDEQPASATTKAEKKAAASVSETSSSSAKPPAAKTARLEEVPAEATPAESVEDLLSGQILDDADFRRIHKWQLRKHAMSAAESRRKAEAAAAGAAESDSEGDGSSADESEEEQANDGFGLTSLSQIEHLHKKPRRQSKAERMASIATGREGREKFGRPKDKGSHVGRTNKQLAKHKNLLMVKQKRRGEKRQRSMHERQRSMKNALKQQQGRKRKR